ncbi:hypothetical protein MTO96_006814 [Rhipicephalus appendiculatus]
MYSFVRGARLYVKGSRDPRDPDDVPDPGDDHHNQQQLSSTSGGSGSRTQMASASQEAREVFRSSHVRSGLKTVHTSRVVRKTTTMTRGEQSQLAIEQEATTQTPRLLESSATQTRSERRRGHKVRKPQVVLAAAGAVPPPVRDRRRAMASSGGLCVPRPRGRVESGYRRLALRATRLRRANTATTKRPDSETGRRRCHCSGAHPPDRRRRPTLGLSE